SHIVHRDLHSFPTRRSSDLFQDAPGGGRDFRADAFAGNERNVVLHGCILLYAKRLRMSKRRSKIDVWNRRTSGAAVPTFCYNKVVVFSAVARPAVRRPKELCLT